MSGDEVYPQTAAQHALLLHPPKTRGRAVVGQKVPPPKGWEQESFRPWELGMALHGREGESDLYLTQNRFKGQGRAVKDLQALGAMYVDLDFYSVPDLAGLSAEAVLDKALARLEEAGMPDPTLALDSGNGAYLVWLHRPVGREQLPSWNAAQNALYSLLSPLGADPAARDAARVLRLAGTANGKEKANGARVRSLRDAREARPLAFEELTRALFAVAPPEREGTERPTGHYSQAVRATASHWKGPKGWSAASLWEGRLTDLQKLRRMRYGAGRPMDDYRNRWLFIAGTAVSWLAVPEVLDRELDALAREVGGWRKGEARRELSKVHERARMAAAGETVPYDGAEVDARYHFTNQRIIEDLEITAEEERGMVTLISGEERKRRNRETQRKRRAGKHRPRATYESKRAADLARRKASARHLKECGLSTAQIAVDMNASERSVRRWLS